MLSQVVGLHFEVVLEFGHLLFLLNLLLMLERGPLQKRHLGLGRGIVGGLGLGCGRGSVGRLGLGCGRGSVGRVGLGLGRGRGSIGRVGLGRGRGSVGRLGLSRGRGSVGSLGLSFLGRVSLHLSRHLSSDGLRGGRAGLGVHLSCLVIGLRHLSGLLGGLLGGLLSGLLSGLLGRRLRRGRSVSLRRRFLLTAAACRGRLLRFS
mmetsp:Transcript_5531/g.12322  ORF Transcript_5531/g.12322 Transcript_5531/m.12322 type:complete len:205 (+) Transcript_5531:4108-4722(+)